MEEEFCELLRLRAVPHLLSPDQNNTLLNLDGVYPSISREGFPVALANELRRNQKVLDSADKVQFYTQTFQGNCLFEPPDRWVTLELLPQPYVLYNASESDHYKQSEIEYAIYTVDSEVAKMSIKALDNHIKINPEKIRDSIVKTKIDMHNKKLESNSRFKISTLLPVQVFYTLMFVKFGGKVVRVLVTRNNLILNDNGRLGSAFTRVCLANSQDEKISSTAEIYTILSKFIRKDYEGFDENSYQSLSYELSGDYDYAREAWRDRMWYYIWVFNGRPQGDPNYGANTYNSLVSESWQNCQNKWPFKWSVETLNRCFDLIVKEIMEFVQSI